MRFEEYLYWRLAEGLLGFEPERGWEIYVCSLYMDFADGPRRFKIWAHYNTLSNLARRVAEGDDPDEARWHFTLWEPDFITAVGLQPEESTELADPEWEKHLSRWLLEEGLFRAEGEAERLMEHQPEQYAAWERRVRRALMKRLKNVARRLQETGILLMAFGRSVPLLLHEWEYDGWSLDATRYANPPGLTDGFEHWLTERNRCE